MKHRSCIYVLVLGILAVALSGCGKDGKDGLAYVGLYLDTTTVVGCDYFYSSGMLPTGPTAGRAHGYSPYTSATYYQVTPGTYYYEFRVYDLYNYSPIYYGNIKIAVNKGDKGGLFTNGDDGADRNYNWFFTFSGSHVSYDQALSAAAASAAQKAAPPMTPTTLIQSAAPQKPDPSLFDIGPARTTTFSDGYYTITKTEYQAVRKGQPAPSGAKAGR